MVLRINSHNSGAKRQATVMSMEQYARECQDDIERIYPQYREVLSLLIDRAPRRVVMLCMGDNVPPWMTKIINKRVRGS